jgi:23S rRNA pseudouridine1911/1915/1917 synthase
MACVQRFEVADMEGGLRLDRCLADRVPSLTRSQAERLIDDSLVTVDGSPAKAGRRLHGGEIVAFSLHADQAASFMIEPPPLHVVYEDDLLLVVDKPAGMVVHPAPGHRQGTLVDALRAHRPALASLDRAGIVHRLDRFTSGLLLVAKTASIRQNLQRQFRTRQVHKVYLALVGRHVSPTSGRIEAPLGRDPNHRQRMAVITRGRTATTVYTVRRYFENHTLLEVSPESGRTHQIRVHLAAIGHPVVGDELYGDRSKEFGLDRFFLHAWRLEFAHPRQGHIVGVEAELPQPLADLLSELSRI